MHKTEVNVIAPSGIDFDSSRPIEWIWLKCYPLSATADTDLGHMRQWWE